MYYLLHCNNQPLTHFVERDMLNKALVKLQVIINPRWGEFLTPNYLYHLSPHLLSVEQLTPRVPDNFLVKKGFEDNKTKRVSFSNRLDGCLRAMSSNLKDKVLFIYRASPDKAITPTIKQVPDAHLTFEKWVLKPVNIQLVGKLKVNEAIEVPLTYRYGVKNTADLYDWDFDIVELNSSIVKTQQLFTKQGKTSLEDGLLKTLSLNESITWDLVVPDSVKMKFKDDFQSFVIKESFSLSSQW